MKKTAQRIFTVIVAAALVFSPVLLCFGETTSFSRVEATREIAVVYDNSGSMYNNMSWSRAKYAMEIFAAMLNANDVLKVYPMHAVTTDGTSKNGGSINSIMVSSLADISKIHNMYTVNALGTPFSTVTKAYNDLAKSTADEKWLIVLTDGDFNNISVDEVANNLRNYSKTVNVQYLGIGEAKDLSSYASGKFYAAKANDSTEVTSSLSSICNKIFQRDVLPAANISGGQITFDVSMSKLIVFTQGNGAAVVSLKGDNGNIIQEESNSRWRATPSNLSAGNYSSAPVDTALQGEVVTFGGQSGTIPKGTYMLEYTGDVQIFYEPNVNMKLELLNSDDQPIDMNGGNITAGDYKVKFGLIDGFDGEFVDSALLGMVSYEAFIKKSDGSQQAINSGEKITLESDNETFFDITATYLNDYTVKTENDKKAYSFCIQETLGVMAVDIQNTEELYELKKLEESEPVKVVLTYNGQKLTDEQLESLSLGVVFDPAIGYTATPLFGESAYSLSFKYKDENVKSTETGQYSMTVTAAMKDEYGREVKGEDKDSFKIIPYPKWVEYAKWIIISAVLLYIILDLLTKRWLPFKFNFAVGKTQRESKMRLSPIYPYKNGKTLLSVLILGAPVKYDLDASPVGTLKLKGLTRLRKPTMIGISNSEELKIEDKSVGIIDAPYYIKKQVQVPGRDARTYYIGFQRS